MGLMWLLLVPYPRMICIDHWCKFAKLVKGANGVKSIIRWTYKPNQISIFYAKKSRQSENINHMVFFPRKILDIVFYKIFNIFFYYEAEQLRKLLPGMKIKINLTCKHVTNRGRSILWDGPRPLPELVKDIILTAWSSGRQDM